MAFSLVVYDDLETYEFKEGDVIIWGTNCFNDVDYKVGRLFPLVARDIQLTKKGSDVKLGSFTKTVTGGKTIITLFTTKYVEDVPDFAMFSETFKNSVPFLKINNVVKDRLIILISAKMTEEDLNSTTAYLKEYADANYPTAEVIALTKKKIQ